ncbi:hypothetical protein [Halorarum salinum]|uniref:DUF8119 domain-containing protein n=1 Tax=Halorarum salinum TaxID=2743089 RepID=A0A7D5Q7H3_9EURY|nr:hypothetical protein [Halobaculum salinum]QLG60237.1 hypothetical protein HUG12_19015 [Halobaculum salinum]
MFQSDSPLRDRLATTLEGTGLGVLLRDLAVVVAWVLVVSFGFRVFGLPTWLYYVVVFAGVVGYLLVSGPWTVRPDG